MNVLSLTQEQIEELNHKLDLILAANKVVEGGKIYTTEEVSKLLDLSKRTLQNYRDRGMITFSQIGRKIYYKHEDVESFINSHKIKSYEKKRN